ncbi:MAG: FecR domain-containing protein, partial [Bacteroidota bacterium]|nr:FecR domain-containing protein [Bacteroidota bacterium]
ACIFVAVISSFLLFHIKQNFNQEINYAHIKAKVQASNECKLILADNSQISIHQTESALRYSVNGRLKINSRQIYLKKIKDSRQSEFNQLIVPWGKRSSILFSDGTKLWLNSGSRAIYPVEFGPRRREIYVEGEAYLEVSHNALRPFTVKTAAMDVKVLGTCFNVCAYPEDKMVSVVLVKGSVKAKVLDSQIKLSPNQMITYNEKTNRANLQNVDVLQYISWKDGWLLCDCEKLEQVFEKLSRYYNCKIRFTDEKAKSFQLSGKLDLKNNIEQVMQVIASTVPIKVDIQNHTINVSSKKKGVLMKKT